jgi:hypothetical protein
VALMQPRNLCLCPLAVLGCLSTDARPAAM